MRWPLGKRQGRDPAVKTDRRMQRLMRAAARKMHQHSADLRRKNRLKSHTAYSVVSSCSHPSLEVINTKKTVTRKVSVCRVVPYKFMLSSTNSQVFRSNRQSGQPSSIPARGSLYETSQGCSGVSFFLPPPSFAPREFPWPTFHTGTPVKSRHTHLRGLPCDSTGVPVVHGSSREHHGNSPTYDPRELPSKSREFPWIHGSSRRKFFTMNSSQWPQPVSQQHPGSQ